MRFLSIVVLGAICAVVYAQDLPPVVGGGSGGLKDLAGSPTLVTVVLKPSGAMDRNLKVVDVGPDFVSVAAEDGERTAYLFSSIQEIRVQSGAVAKEELNLEQSTSLRVEEQRVLDRALQRTREIFDVANADQNLKMRAAALIAACGGKEGFEYLDRLAASNHVETELDAYQCLFLAGRSEVPGELIATGLQSGNRVVKAKAALVAGLMNNTASQPTLQLLLEDRLAEISAPAAKALARMGSRDVIPALMKMAGELHEQKGAAAVFGLSRLGGPDVISQVKAMLAASTGTTRYRLIEVLYKLQDPDAMTLLAKEGLKNPGVALKSAVSLAQRGDWDGRQYLVAFLKNKYFDETEKNLVDRAEASIALIAANDLTAVSALQNLLSVNQPQARKKMCLMMAELGKRKLIPVIQPIVENSDMEVSLEACTAVVAMAKPQFRQRLVEMME